MSQKLENLLNLALDADQGERERSEELDVGYDKEENVWELIVKYSGTLEAVRQTARSVTELLRLLSSRKNGSDNWLSSRKWNL